MRFPIFNFYAKIHLFSEESVIPSLHVKQTVELEHVKHVVGQVLHIGFAGVVLFTY